MLSNRRSLSLATYVTLLSMFTTAVAMVAYAAIQYVTMPDTTLLGLLFNHGWHVLVIGGLTYGALAVTLHRQVVRPIRELYVKCYAATKGDMTLLDLESPIEEVRAIGSGINMMLSRLSPDSREAKSNERTECANLLRHVISVEEERLCRNSCNQLLELADRLEKGAPSHNMTLLLKKKTASNLRITGLNANRRETIH